MSRVPATVLGGFLGSGKTTLLNYLLHRQHGFRLAVVVNEFGAVGVDGKAVAGGEQFVELDNGCLCCALNADLERLLRDLKVKGGFDQLVLETTGLADPLPIAWTFSRPGLSDFYRLDAIVTVVDAVNVARVLAEADEARLQIERADVLVLNKMDLVPDDGAAAEALVRRHNTEAPLVRAVHGQVPWELLLTGADTQPLTPPAEHHTAFDTWSYELDGVVAERRLEDMLYEVPGNVYRVKGLLQTDAGSPWTLVNVVAGRIDLRPIEPRVQPAHGCLVFIGKGLDRTALAALCTSLRSS